MRKFLLCALVLLVAMVGMVTASSSWCYQEFANVSTGCGGLGTGNYKLASWNFGPANTTDGNWSTLGIANSNGELLSNYTIPFYAKNSSLWQVKDNTASGQRNLTLPKNCINTGTTLVTLVWYDTAGTCGFSAFDYWCHNNTKTSYIESCADCWEFIGCSADSSNGFYEEAMNWNITKPDPPATAFISTWNTSQPGSASNQVVLPITGTYTVEWGDALSNYSVATHTYTTPGVYTITINGTITGWNFNNGGDKLKILNVTKWGDLRLGNAGNGYFYGCANLDLSSVSDTLNLSGTTTLRYMFEGDTALTTINNSNSWDTSQVTTMQNMFYLDTNFNSNVASWNTSKVTDMSSMFQFTSFNQNITGWNTAQVTTMSNMFSSTPFNQNINGWNVGNVQSISGMFQSDTAFNQNLSDWNTNNVTLMSFAFSGDSAFNGNVTGWNTGKVTTFNSMFYNDILFNQNLSKWNTSQANSLQGMFAGDSVFNGDVTTWDTHNVTMMAQVFQTAIVFNQDITKWNTSAVTDMSAMFNGATIFNQSIGVWDTRKVQTIHDMFYGTTKFDQNLSAWNTSQVTSFVNMFYTATGFNGDVSGWDTHNATSMQNMFAQATKFNQNLSNWNTSKVTDMSNVFQSATVFNGNITGWDTSQVNTMSNMFYNAPAFNQNIGSWNTGKVTTMVQMFRSDTAFNQPIGNWDTHTVNTMANMFQGATAFNQNIGKWNVSAVTTMNQMFLSDTLSTAMYDALLDGWASRTEKLAVPFGAGSSKYANCSYSGLTNRLILNTTYNWTITDGGLDSSFLCPTNSTNSFISVWDTTQTSSGSSNSTGITMPITGTYTVNWGDGTQSISTASHQYTSSGQWTVTINGSITGFTFNNAGDKLKIQSIKRWGDCRLGNVGGYFFGCSNLDLSSVDDVLNLSGTTTFINAFSSVSKTTTINNINSWDVSNITDMSAMFNGATNFNQNLSNWNTGKVITMSNMFASATAFNGNVSNWNTSNVASMSNLFNGATNFNQPIGSWDVGKILSFGSVFASASNFNQNLTNWDTRKATSFASMFYLASAFNGNIGGWNTSNVLSTNGMFQSATNFNQPIGSWDTHNVTDMASMFYLDTNFNQDITNWNTNKVTTMVGMFRGDTAFNQNIGKWNVSSVTTMANMFFSNTLPTATYNSILDGWASRFEKSAVQFSAGNSKYGNCTNSGLYSRLILNTTYTWVISDGGLNTTYICPVTPAANITLTNFTSDGGCSVSGTCPWTHTNATNFVLTTTNANFCNSTPSTTLTTINCTTSDSTTYNCLHNSIPLGATTYHFTCNGTAGWSNDTTFNLSRTDIAVSDSVSPASPASYGSTVTFSANASSSYNISSLTFTINGTQYPVYSYSPYCYQESANISNQTGIDNCNGMDYTGTYSTPNENIDGAISKQIFYKVPSGATNNSIWTIKYGSDTSVKYYNIPAGCWNGVNLTFNFASRATSSPTRIYAGCINASSGAKYQIQETTETVWHPSGCNVVCSNEVWDGNWSTSCGWTFTDCAQNWWTDTGSTKGILYEEAMNWSMNPVNLTSRSVVLTPSSGTYFYNWTANDTQNVNISTTTKNYTINAQLSPSVNVTLGTNISKVQWIVPFYTGTTAYNVTPTNQTDSIGLFNVQNNGTVSINVTANMSDTYNNVTTFCSNSSSFSTVYVLSISPTVVFNSLAVGSPVQKLWCMRNYTAIPTTKKNVVFSFDATSS
jgi:surface protein